MDSVWVWYKEEPPATLQCNISGLRAESVWKIIENPPILTLHVASMEGGPGLYFN